MAQSVRGKTAIVTGAGSGINFCFVKLLLEHGCNCVLADLALRPEAKELVLKYSTSAPRAIFQPTDVTDWSQLETMFKAAEEEFGEVDIVCPGAGVYEPPFSSFWYPPGSNESRDSPAGSRTPKSIIHISSIAGQIGSLSTPLYSATKHAINGFVRSLAKLDKIGIRVAAVAPGFIKTPLWTESTDKMRMVDESKDEWVTPEDVALVMLALIERDQISESILAEPKGEGVMIPIKGGTILEVSKSVRKVSSFNDPGPLGRPGNSMGDHRAAEEGFLELVQSGSWGEAAKN
ncbi:hypothetical protein CIHG_01115 [Coccidioides immitis H538.4]|uniref:NAD-dependent 15-hydroxyprostaglandin dehydrogenase n=2 Tax=Coccidioides immitis TaxID=5501 RepID=A0A0J8QQF7_COCIT|nr:hypothetical protein CISG_00729 [Coccidioides immitis RMSCC 3703]KMU83333.1 hypothetical protein CIHG_01115 [Coccidioides immitis H538.4]